MFEGEGRDATPRPFLKWAGGKRALLEAIVPRLLRRARKIEHYVEPFLGGGAVFLALARRKLVRKAVLADRNPELIAAWRAIQQDPEAVIQAAGRWRHDKDVFYEVRAMDFRALAPAEIAGRMIYLNKTGFNGLYRKNSKGGFNVPFGSYTNPTIVDADNLRAVSAALRDVDLVEDDFQAVLEAAPRGAVVYCDPPYWPLSLTSSFNFYDGLVFGREHQERLARVFRALPARRVRGVLSNSWCEETVKLYEDLGPEQVMVRRRINSKVTHRGEIPELLVGVG